MSNQILGFTSTVFTSKCTLLLAESQKHGATRHCPQNWVTFGVHPLRLNEKYIRNQELIENTLSCGKSNETNHLRSLQNNKKVSFVAYSLPHHSCIFIILTTILIYHWFPHYCPLALSLLLCFYVFLTFPNHLQYHQKWMVSCYPCFHVLFQARSTSSPHRMTRLTKWRMLRLSSARVASPDLISKTPRFPLQQNEYIKTATSEFCLLKNVHNVFLYIYIDIHVLYLHI